MVLDNIVAMQNQLRGVDDGTIRRALSSPNEAVPQFLLMMEMKRRSDMRSSTPQGPVKPKDMRSEMAMGVYQPVPPPPVGQPGDEASSPDNQGIMSGMGAGGNGGAPQPPQPPQGQIPQSLDMSKPAGLGSLFSGKR